MEMVTVSRTEYEQMKSLQAQVAALQQEVSWLTEQIRLARKQRFGSSSEKSPADDRTVQLSYLFNEPECMTGENAPEPDMEVVVVKAYARKERRSVQEKLPEDIKAKSFRRHCLRKSASARSAWDR